MSEYTDLKADQLEETNSNTEQPEKTEPPIEQALETDSKAKDSDSDSESSAPSFSRYTSIDSLEEEAKTIDTCDEGVFSDVLSNIRNLKVKTEAYKRARKQAKNEEAKLSKKKKGTTFNNSNTSTTYKEEADESRHDVEAVKEDLDKLTTKEFLIDWYYTLVQLLNVLEEYKNDITKQNYLAVRKETYAVSKTFSSLDTPLDDRVIACANEIFYLYFNFFTLQLVKNYSTLHTDMNEVVKMLYEKSNDMQHLIDHDDILLLMQNYVKEYHQSSIFPQRSKTSELFLDFIGSYCSKIELVPNLIKLGFPESVVRCIKIIRKSYRDRRNKENKSKNYRLRAVKRLIVIVYNICRHEDGIHVLNSLYIGPILEKIQIRQEKEIHSSYRLARLLYMTLTLLSMPDQIRMTRKQINKCLDDMLDVVDYAADEDDYRALNRHVSEPLVVLVKLMIYDGTLDYVIQHAKLSYMKETTILEFLVNLFVRYHAEVNDDDDSLKLITCTALCNIFWHVSLRPQYKQQLQKTEKFKTLIEQLADEQNDKTNISNYQCYVPTYMNSIQKMANSILSNIFDQQRQQEETQQSERHDVYALTESIVSIESASADSTYPKSTSDAHKDQQETDNSKHEETKLDDLISSDSAATSGSSSSDSDTTSSDDDKSDISDAFHAGNFWQIVTKVRTLKEQATTPDRLVKSNLIDFQHIQVELVNLIERTKITNIISKNYLALEKAVKHSMESLLKKDQLRQFANNNPDDAKETLYLYFSFFKLSGIQNYLLHSKMYRTLKQFYRNRVVNVLSAMSLVIVTCSFTKQDLEKLSDYNDILSLMLNYVNAELESVTITPKLSRTTEKIVRFVWGYADKTVLVPNLIKVGYSEAVLEWLSIIYDCGKQHSHIKRTKAEKRIAVYPIIFIIQNISRHDDGIQSLISCNALNLIKKVQNDIDPEDELTISIRMTLALLSKPEEIRNDRKRMNAVLDYMLQTIVDGSKSKDFSCEDYHISEPLIVLAKLICYDRTLDYILQHADVDFDEGAKDEIDDQIPEQSMVECFIDLFVNYYSTVKDDDPMKVTTCTALCNILWSVSLRTQYKQEFQKKAKFKELIEQIAHDKAETISTHYVPKYIENIQKAAEGILCNISDAPTESQKLEKRPLTALRALVFSMKSSPVNSSTNPNLSKPSVLISYSHSDNDACTELYNELAKRHQDFDIWIDRKYCKTGYLWGKIADGMQEASIILCVLSNKYYESKSCQQEFVYAHDHLKKQVIPVFLQQDKPPGWIAIHTCILKYIRFKQTKPLEQNKLAELMEMIDEYLSLNNKKDDGDTHKVTISSTPPTHYEPASSAIMTTTENKPVIQSKEEESNTQKLVINLDEKPVSEWNKEYVFQWFQQNEILPELYKLHPFKDGSELLNYATRILNDQKVDAHCNNYSQAYTQTSNGKILLIPQFLRFVDALRKLYNDNESKSRMEVVQPFIEVTASNRLTTGKYSRLPRRSSLEEMQQ